MSQKIITASLFLATSVSAFAGKGPLDSSMYDSWVQVPGHFDVQRPDLCKGYLPSALEPMLGKHDSQSMSYAQKFDFADLGYKAAKKDTTVFDNLVQDLNNQGWSVQRLKGKTGKAAHQVEATMGIIAFRGKEVVISTRGTMNGNDWTTDFRFDRDILGTLLGMLTDNQENHLKNQMIGAQFLGVNGTVHNGFLQTHLDMWPQIRNAILDYANQIGCQVSDLTFKTVGHSLGGALQDLNMVHLLEDSQLGLGKKTLESSFVDQEIDSLGKSGFYGLKVTTDVPNTKVEGLAIEGPGVFGSEVVDHLEAKIGEGNLVHVENVGDPIPHAAALVGLEKIGTVVTVDGGGAPVAAHRLGDVKKVAVDHLDNKGSPVAEEKSIARHISDAVVGAGQAVVNAGRAVVNTISNAILNVTDSIWNYWVS